MDFPKAPSPTKPIKFDPSVSDEPSFRMCIKIEKTHKYVLYQLFGDSFCVENLGRDEYNEFGKLFIVF